MPATLSPTEIQRLIRVSRARSADATRPTLSGVFIEPMGPHALVAVATDGFCLAWTHINALDHGLSAPVLLKDAACKILSKVKPKKQATEEFVISAAGEAVRFELHQAQHGLPTVLSWDAAAPGATFPAWRKVLPTGQLHPAPRLSFSTSQLVRADMILQTSKDDRISFAGLCMSPDPETAAIALAHWEGITVGVMPILRAGSEADPKLLAELELVRL